MGRFSHAGGERDPEPPSLRAGALRASLLGSNTTALGPPLVAFPTRVVEVDSTGAFGATLGSFPGPARALAAADLSGDGRRDVVHVNSLEGAVVRTGLGSPAGMVEGPSAAIDATSPASTTADVAVADLDGDGLLDVVVLDDGVGAVRTLLARP